MDLAEGKTPYYQEDARLTIAALPLPLKDKAGISLFGAFPSDSYKVLAGGPAEAVVIMANARNRPKLIAIIPFRVSGIQSPEIALGATLTVGPEGATRPVEIAIKNSYENPGALYFLAEIPLSALEPGPASLFLTAVEKSTGARSHAATRFRILE